MVILAVAVLPMVAMFDMGLNAAGRGAELDRARVLAGLQLEHAQSLPYGVVKNRFPNAPCSFDGSGECEAAGIQEASGEFDSFRYSVTKQYVRFNGDEDEFVATDTDRGMIEVTVTVGWGGAAFDEKTYTATALKTR